MNYPYVQLNNNEQRVMEAIRDLVKTEISNAHVQHLGSSRQTLEDVYQRVLILSHKYPMDDEISELGEMIYSLLY